MALAGVTGGELRIKDTVPGDLRMIRLVFERLGLRTELDGDDVLVPGGQKLVVQADVGDYKSKIQDGPWPAFPADLTSIAVALATQAEGSILVHEWMFENRLIFTDKLILMGADIVMCDPHRAIVTGPRRLRGERVESPDIRAGMAMLLAALCAEGRSEIGNIRQIDRGYERIDERLRELGAQHRARATEPVAAASHGVAQRLVAAPVARQRMIHPIPSGTRDVLPDETREVRAITDTLRGVFERHGYGEVYTPALEYESVLARADMAEARPAYRVFDETGAVLVLRSDMTVPIARVVATRYAAQRAAAALLLLRPLLPRRTPAARAAARAAAGRDRADRLARAAGHRRGADRALPRARRGRPEGLPRSASATPRCSRP